ncbi:unnamed protein product [Brachionus calyciflorus]|uniref:Uncharacterized protein n=1 Tax=Brachionus calyciflorus TaxID=104777 RepID=A0A814HRY9_9BILA|nr:unnamed protein product [Brachionus calyciflorus]
MDLTKNLVKSVIIFDIDHNVDVTNGELIVSIPFPLMSAPNINILPKLKLVYRSGQYLKNGILGLGWSSDGLSQISRCSKTITNDGPIDDYTLKFNFDDPFCLDEQRLLATKGKHGFADSEYVTQNDQFNRIVAFGQNVKYNASQTVEVDSNNHPNYFKMYSKDNLIFTYGNGANSDVKHPDLANQTYKIVFEYEQRLPTDHVQTYFNKALIQNIEKRLKKIKFHSNNKFAKAFEIDYKSIEPTKQSLLKKVSMCFDNKHCSKPIEFNYSSEEPLFNFLSKPIYHENVCGESSFCELIQMIDLNGDGLKDIVGFGQDAIYVSLNEGNFFYKAERWSSAFCQDSGWNSSKHVRYLADINNDNLPDLVGFGDNGVFVSLNDNGKFLTMEKWSSDFGFNSGW